jgi:hypothetical protein
LPMRIRPLNVHLQYEHDIQPKTLDVSVGSYFVVKWFFILEAAKRPGWGILAVPDHLNPGCRWEQ